MDSERLDVKNRIIRIDEQTDKRLTSFKSQNYESLRNEFLIYKRLYEDSLFPAEMKSLFYDQELTGVFWKRPKEICENPVFLHTLEPKVYDLDQGILSTPLVFGCSSIILKQDLFSFIVPENQTFDSPNYIGLFHFRFWYYGKWVDVVIDDRLPVDSENQFIFGKNKNTPNEFWFPLFEKAYAKLCGCYQNLEGLSQRDMMVDLTGGICEEFDLTSLKNEIRKKEVWNFMNKSLDRESLIRSYMAKNPKIRGSRLPNGLAVDRYYVVCNLETVTDGNQKVQLVKIKNQWDEKVEWRLPWAKRVNDLMEKSDDIKKMLETNPSEFWITYEDFYRYFETIQITEFTVDAFFLKTKNQWNVLNYHGEWVPRKSSGGCGRYRADQYWKNPQLLFTLPDDNMSTVIISLYQKYTRENKMEKKDNYRTSYIQFRFYKVKDDQVGLEANKNCSRLYANQLERCSNSGCYINTTEVVRRFKLSPGSYVVIPSNYEMDVSEEFLLRICTEAPILMKNTAILEEFKIALEREDVIFELDKISDGVSKDLKLDMDGFAPSNKNSSIKELRFYVKDAVCKENDKIDVYKKNKFFD